MGRGGYRRHAVAGRDRSDSPAEMAQVGARFGEAGAHAGADLDLRTQKFGADLARQQRLTIGQHFGWRIVDDIARRAVDEKILLLDAEGEFRFGGGHPQLRALCSQRLADRPRCHQTSRR